jgi:hypothetical protein
MERLLRPAFLNAAGAEFSLARAESRFFQEGARRRDKSALCLWPY